jgi:hypothetical protein
MYAHVTSAVSRQHIFAANLAVDFIAHGPILRVKKSYTKQIGNKKISSAGQT